MSISRTTRIVSAAWLLFWGLLLATALQDFIRDAANVIHACSRCGTTEKRIQDGLAIAE